MDLHETEGNGKSTEKETYSNHINDKAKTCDGDEKNNKAEKELITITERLAI